MHYADKWHATDRPARRSAAEKGGRLFPKPRMPLLLRLAIGCGVLILLAGCGLLPEVVHQPTYHNPFPQLTKVAIAPFFNLSAEPTVDGRQFAQAYFNELQAIPGFEVVPLNVVEEKARELNLSLANPVEVRQLAQALEVDAVVIGGITDYSPYYPPRCALHMEWYAANPGFHPIPVGYGLPWGTTEEEYIPDTLVLETELNLAREQLKTQTPTVGRSAVPVSTGERPKAGTLMAMLSARDKKPARQQTDPAMSDNTATAPRQRAGQLLSYQAPDASETAGNGSHRPAELKGAVGSDADGGTDSTSPPSRHRTSAPALLPSDSEIAAAPLPALPPDWPDPRGLIPPPPSPARPIAQPTYEPVLRHTRTYNGNDVRFITALENYTEFRDDARIGGWQSYLQRTDDFIRFCCHMHVTEMLTARGGAGETRVVWRWPERR